MASGIRGRLITATFAESLLSTLPGFTPVPAPIAQSLDAWASRLEAAVGPASGVRTIADLVAIPLLKLLGFATDTSSGDRDACVLCARTPGHALAIVVVGWDEPLDRAWRGGVLAAVGADARWCLCCNGRALRVVDARHTWSRRFLEFDLSLVAEEPVARQALWTLLRAEAFATRPPLLDAAVELSARQGANVCKALGDGVLDALGDLLTAIARPGRKAPADVFEQSLTVLYRVLFLLFAEARGLVPVWHPVYRDRYTIESIVSTLLSGRRYRGVWQAVHAISRLAHSGCAAGELKVTAFNGRLFAPAHSTAFERARLDDEVMGRAVLAVSTTAQREGRVRIAYADLDVEQLGAVYEHVLDYQPRASEPAAFDRTRDARKATGTFYTPRALTDHLVRRTLAPLASNRSSDAILSLRILDPAMGSGAFLVAACRYLGEAVEDARIGEGLWHPADVRAADRAALRREIALRCLFGVDLNPMAVQLARLSIWLATLASDKPLTFLDHHLVVGNSLVGATPEDVRRQPSRAALGRGRVLPLPLFDEHALAPMLEAAVRVRSGLVDEPDESAAVVHHKERALAALQARHTPLGSWTRVLDLWCAGWFHEGAAGPDPRTYSEACAYLLGRGSSLPEHVASAIVAKGDAIARQQRFLHWPLAFPEVFAGTPGDALANPGFDAVIGNPPWDMIRGDSGDAGVREGRRSDARRLTDFVREAGIYKVESGAHANRYQLFLERALQLVRKGGRVGLVLPSGVVADSGAAALRRHLFDRAAVDTVTGFDNRSGIFPIHRSVRFVLLTCTTGAPTTQSACRFGLSTVDELEAPLGGVAHAPLVLTRRLLTRLSGAEDLGLPDLRTASDLAIVEKITAETPWLGATSGWHVHFGRELNATDDRDAFVEFRGSPSARPVLEGKQIDPFRAWPEHSRLELSNRSPAAARVPRRSRLAYRDVASATNRLTLIAAIIPAHCVTTHTLFCLKTPLPLDAQHVLCALLNSFVANYLIRLRVNTHVTASLMARLPVPLIAKEDLVFTRLAGWSRALSTVSGSVEATPEYAELQATVARLYRLTSEDFQHVLSTFPLINSVTKGAVLEQFSLVTNDTPRR
jgi:Eco57I restriction-modification methylase